MDDDKHVAIIEQPDGSMLDRPVLVARNGGACRVRSNAVGSKSASAPVHALKSKKQRRALGEYVLPNVCGRTNGSSFANTGPAFALALMMKTLSLMFTSKLAN